MTANVWIFWKLAVILHLKKEKPAHSSLTNVLFLGTLNIALRCPDVGMVFTIGHAVSLFADGGKALIHGGVKQWQRCHF